MAHPYVIGAASYCQKPAFRRFLTEKMRYPITDTENAADALRQLCGVNSRAELATNERARAAYRILLKEFATFTKTART